MVIIFLNITNSAAAQILWQNAEYGMSIEQIQDLFPSSFIPNNPDWYYDGSEHLRLSNYEIVNRKFIVSFIKFSRFNTPPLCGGCRQ
jgi:hypothetical protein